MIWAILAVLGVPLWLIALALLNLAYRNRTLRHRPGNVPVRVRAPGKRWKRGHGVWVHDTFAFRGSPAAWEEVLEYVQRASARPATPEEDHKLRRLDDPIIATLTTADGRTIEAAASSQDRINLLGPFDVDVEDHVGSDAAQQHPAR